jgi:hypothetical protein
MSYIMTIMSLKIYWYHLCNYKIEIKI